MPLISSLAISMLWIICNKLLLSRYPDKSCHWHFLFDFGFLRLFSIRLSLLLFMFLCRFFTVLHLIMPSWVAIRLCSHRFCESNKKMSYKNWVFVASSITDWSRLQGKSDLHFGEALQEISGGGPRRLKRAEKESSQLVLAIYNSASMPPPS